MKKVLMATTLIASAPSAMALPFMDLEAGGGMTFPSLDSGQLGEEYSLTDSGGTQEDLDLSAENGFYLNGRIGIPIVPDLKLRYERLNYSNDNFEKQFEFYGETFNADGQVDLDMSYLDTAFVYGLPDLAPGVDYFVDFGLNLRWMLGGVDAEVQGGDSRSEEFPAIPLPAGHLAGGVTIPVADVQVSGELNTLPINGLGFNDWNIKARWFAPLPTDVIARLGIEAGYRNWSIDIDGEEASWLGDEDTKLEFSTSGFFVGTSLSF